jgi:hypothetical protein
VARNLIETGVEPDTGPPGGDLQLSSPTTDSTGKSTPSAITA